MVPRRPALEVGCWSGRARVGWMCLNSCWMPTHARRSDRVGSRRDPSDGQVSLVIDFAIPLPRRGAGAFIVSDIGHSYLITLLHLWFTLLSYLSTMLVVLAVRRASTGKGCRSYLCRVGCTTVDAPILASDQLLVSGRPRRRGSCPRGRGRPPPPPPREDLLEVPDYGAEDEVLCSVAGLWWRWTERSSGIDLIELGLGNLIGAGADPTEWELGNLNGA
ncbi:hypothetical protein B296_00057268 [Ensete ventricosum]|uniref:Uncharacterized protein n=1 Tax=Ensete ventricosum TaxID=4639 RepID=A0A426X0H7_ENSVE|nr:hypothetical protein B296_00057268 [Ensete ventricosum]